MQLAIRHAQPDDYETLCAIYQEIDALHREHLPDRFQKVDGPGREKEFLLDRLADPKVAFLVATAPDRLLGFVQASLMDTLAIPTLRPRQYVYVNETVVRSEYRGQGIGGRLMAAAEEWAIAQGATSIELGMYEFNTGAMNFYEGLGYSTLHRRLNKTLGRKNPAA